MPPDLQKKWQERIERAKKTKKEWEDQFRVQLGRDYWEGKQNPGYPEEEWVTINKLYSHFQAQWPSLYSVDPYFYVKLKKSHAPIEETELMLMAQTGQPPPKILEMEAKAKTRQAMLNYLKGELGLKTKARLGIQDSHFAFGVLKCRRASDQQKHQRAGEPILDDDGKPLMDEQTGEALLYPETIPVNERYELSRVHPDDILVDEDAGPLEDSWKWVAQHIKLTKAEALDDPRFPKNVVRSIKGKAREEKEEAKGLKSWIGIAKGRDPEDEFIDLWEIYDIRKREMLILAEDADDLLIKPRSLPPGIEKHPFSFLRFTLRDKSPYPLPPVSPAIDPQKEISLSRSRWMTHRKRFNRKYEADVTRLEDPDTELAKLESGADGTIVRKRGPGAVIDAIQDAPLDQQGIIELQALDNDVVEALGSPGNARGVANADSATEASILDTRLEIREGDKLSMVVDWIIDTARKLDMLVQFHIDADEAVKIAGPQGEAWQLVKKADYEEIQGEYEYSVNVGASQPRLPDIERAQWIAFVSQVIIPMPNILTRPRIMKKMAEMFHIEDEAALEEFRQMGLAMLAGAEPMPGGQGGGPSDNPVAAIMGAAMGQQGGNTNGGGSPMLRQ